MLSVASFCDEKSKLLDQLSAAVIDYSRATFDLIVVAGSRNPVQFQVLRGIAVDAHRQVDSARAELQQHRLTHQC